MKKAGTKNEDSNKNSADLDIKNFKLVSLKYTPRYYMVVISNPKNFLLYDLKRTQKLFEIWKLNIATQNKIIIKFWNMTIKKTMDYFITVPGISNGLCCLSFPLVFVKYNMNQEFKRK